MTWVDGLIPHVKALHVSFVLVWIAGLFALPFMLAHHKPTILQEEFAQIRRATHYSYVWLITPVAVLAITSGLALIFMRNVFTVWLFTKLIAVSGLVTVHAWIGHTIIEVAETKGEHDPPDPLIPAMTILILVIVVLGLVLAKPHLQFLPEPTWISKPLGRQLPFDTPNR